MLMKEELSDQCIMSEELSDQCIMKEELSDPTWTPASTALGGSTCASRRPCWILRWCTRTGPENCACKSHLYAPFKKLKMHDAGSSDLSPFFVPIPFYKKLPVSAWRLVTAHTIGFLIFIFK